MAPDADDAPQVETFADDAAGDAVDDDAPTERAADPQPDAEAQDAEAQGDEQPLVHVGPVDETDLATAVRELLDDADARHDIDASGCDEAVSPVVGTGEYLGLPVVLGPDPTATFARAVDPDDCTVLLEAALPGG